MMLHQRGQALLELSIVVGTTGVFILLLVPWIYQTLQERYKDGQRMQIELAEAPWRDYFQLPERSDVWWRERGLFNETKRTRVLTNDANYPFAQSIAPLWSLFDWQTEFSLPLNTAYSARLSGLDDAGNANTVDYLHFRRIHHDWSPNRSDDLVARPQSLTATAALNGLGFHYVQQVVSWLPFAREFAPGQLELGRIDTSVVPIERVCTEALC
ncbi:hypothetical protein FM042_01010 [Aliidiomarina halalkaliphila]|uniref:Uncharacterized protein n=1 Tax=Aliidiomarina halalkaliphila TaxID=2593535 RepID=A0A552X3B0_9GAMM|nr:hypothetical protein [Aliidiomarina halalkaliphila]TRW49475.1 hypothetical protein FM042_01010 [Aliidiomarina halalkaliphila]